MGRRDDLDDFARGVALLKQRRFTPALRCLKRYQPGFPDYIRAVLIGLCLEGLRRNRQAERAYREAALQSVMNGERTRSPTASEKLVANEIRSWRRAVGIVPIKRLRKYGEP